jgi:hypothetical protein|tara:strand:- start:98 stop:880 length:783 start_codon:yes stop_codon:yes gene_type:complete
MANVKMQENLVKYLAGLCDADASLSFRFNRSKNGFMLHLILHLSAAESIDKKGSFVKSLPSITGFGNITSRDRNNWARVNQWQVQSRRDLNMLLPRLLKHMVIKAKHWQTLFDIYTEQKGLEMSEVQMDQLKILSQNSRKNSGSLRHKNHPTWAWTAGYLDGDGSFMFKKHPSGYGMKLMISAISHKGDRVALDLLHKAFNGYVYERKDNCTEWKRNLGVRDKTFALHFLGKLVNHLKLKKHKVEQMLSFLHATGLTTTD